MASRESATHWASLTAEHVEIECQSKTASTRRGTWRASPSIAASLFTVETATAKEQGLWDKCIPEPTFGACSRGRNVCYGKDAENNHTRI